MDFEVLMWEVAVEKHSRGRKEGTGNKQNRLHVSKIYAACCCFTSSELELKCSTGTVWFFYLDNT